MKLTHFAGAALLLGALSPQTFAQSASIVPSGQNALAPGTAVPARIAAPIASSQVMTDVSFRDIAVTEVLNMISQGFDVPMVVAADVNGIVLPAINLPNKTPDAAIQAITVAAGLRFRKLADGTYLIAKTLPDDPAMSPSSGAITLPGGARALDNPFGQGITQALPPLGDGNFDAGTNLAPEMPVLVDNTAQREVMRRQYIRVRNVSPSLMAFWLDPANHPMPVQLQSSVDNRSRYGQKPIAKSALSAADQIAQREALNASLGSSYAAAGFNAGSVNPYTQQRDNADIRANAQFGGGGNNRGGGGGNNRGGGGNNRGGNNRGGAGGGGGGVFDLPEGVDRIVAIDPQNALLVFGTDEGVRELNDTINFLDRPLRQVEIEAQFVTVTTGSTNSFGINYNTSQGNFNATAQGFAPAPPTNAGSLQVGFVRGNFQATLSALISQNRAKVITAPRVLAINNLTASLQSETSTPVVLSTVSQNIGGQQATGQNLFYITTAIGLTVTPTINNDNTITVLMQPELSTQTPGQIAPTVTQQTLETIANVRDGDTIALGGLKAKNVGRSGDKIPLLSNIPLIGGLFRSKVETEAESDLIIFLTARIVRRVDDDTEVPGT